VPSSSSLSSLLDIDLDQAVQSLSLIRLEFASLNFFKFRNVNKMCAYMYMLEAINRESGYTIDAARLKTKRSMNARQVCRITLAMACRTNVFSSLTTNYLHDILSAERQTERERERERAHETDRDNDRGSEDDLHICKRRALTNV
jgi:hypothetical protein